MNGFPKTAHMKFICCPRRFIWSNHSSITGSRLDLNPRPCERQRITLPQLSTLTVAPPRRLICREAKDNYYEKCKEIERLDKMHSHLLHQKIKELRPKGNKMLQAIKSKQGKVLSETDEVIERWAEYVEELYTNENRGQADVSDVVNEDDVISSDDIETVIKDL